MHFNEELLHFVWQFRLYDSSFLLTTEGYRLNVLHCGFPHKNAGPDFTNAKIVIEDTTWAGNVEIHIKSSDWKLHQHQLDAAYDNVILHVVYENDEPIYRTDGSLIPTLVLSPLINNNLLAKYERLLYSSTTFPCQAQIKEVDSFIINGFLSRTLVERLAEKTEEVYEHLRQLNGNWDETFYQFMAKAFGFKVNALPMQMLARALPQQLFAKHKDQPLQIEALIFGQSGFLNQEFEDEYPNKLKNEYDFLRKKYRLMPIDISLWKFLRMRPQNFPTLRLAQFAALVTKSHHLFSKIIAVRNMIEMSQLFENLPVNSFWETHYHFNKKADKVNLQLGKSSINNILMNTVALFLFAYGRYTDQHNFETRAFYLLESISAEHNAVVDEYVKSGVAVRNGYQSQALLQLKKRYCDEKRCLQCTIGLKLLRN